MTALSNWLIATTGQGSLWLMAWSWQALILTGCMWLVLNLWRIKSLHSDITFGCLGLSRSDCSRCPQLSPGNFPRYSRRVLH